ncbi:MAG: sialidase family protein [Halioglobus sp.]
MKTFIRLLIAIAAVSQCFFLYLFVINNAPGLSSAMLVAAIAVVFGIIFVSASYSILRATTDRDRADEGSTFVVRLLLPLLCGLLLWVFLDSTVTDYYQPLSLYDEAIIALAVSWGSLILALLVTALFASSFSLGLLRSSLALALIAILGWPLAASLAFINQPVFGEALEDVQHLFVGGHGGYDIYRIPALLNLPAGSVLASGRSLKTDRLLAFAEARRDGSLDTGVIDLVLRHSDNAGVSWSEQRVVCRHQKNTDRGKCGNATPLYDTQTGNVLLAYNLSGINSDEHDGVFHSAEIMLSPDAGSSWKDAVQVANDNFVLGPGHGIQKQFAPNKGRLLLPGYVKSSAQVLYSDDNGLSWQRSAAADTGNETELAELPGGAIYMTTRHRAPIGRPPRPNGRLFSISTDGGVNWNKTELDKALATPVCQATVLLYEQKLLLFANPSHPRSRVNLEVKLSKDDGKSWQQRIPVHSGPSGYSQLAQDSDANIFVLFESGIMAYSEKITLARIPPEAINL